MARQALSRWAFIPPLKPMDSPRTTAGTGLGQPRGIIVVCTDSASDSRLGSAPTQHRMGMSRTLRHRLIAVVSTAMALACLGVSAPRLALAEAQVNARGWSHDTFGRLVLDRAARLVTSVEVKDRKLVIAFSEPVSVTLGGALENLKTYVEGPSRAEGRMLELTLTRPATLSQFVEEGKFVLDLRPTGTWPAETAKTDAVSPAAKLQTGAGIPPAVKPNAEAPGRKGPEPPKEELSPVPNVTAAPPKIVARQGDHGTFTRLAIDWPSKTGYRITREGDRIAVTFTAPADIDLGPARARLPRELIQIAALNDSVARIYLTLAPGASLRDFRLGRTIVLDIVRPAKLTASAPPLHLPQLADAPPTIAAAPEGAGSAPTSTGTIAEAPAAAPPQTSDVPAPGAAPQLALKSLPAMPEPAPTAPTGEAAAQLAATPAVEQAALRPRAPVDVQIKIAPAENGARIMFSWPEAVAAAAFRRNGALWLAFDLPANKVDALFADARIAKLGEAKKIEIPDATIIRIAEASSPLGVAMTASGKSWIVDVTPGGKDAPITTIDQRRETLADGAASLLLRTNGPGRVASVADPGGAGRLYIVPVRPAGLGVASQAGWPEFQVLPSYQGVVIAGLGDAITVESLSQGVVVTTRPQGVLSPVAQEQIASQEQEVEPGESTKSADHETKVEKETEPVLASVPGLFDLPTWRRGGEATFNTDRRQLEAAVSNAAEADKAVTRMALGEFYFAHGLIDEADSALSEIGREGRDRLNQRELALLGAAVQTLRGDLDKARASLSAKTLAGVAESNLFLALLAAREEKWEVAAKHLADPLPDIADYPKPVRGQIYLMAGTALNNAGNPIGAQRFADALRQDQPDRDAKDRLAYLDGHIKLKIGERDEALGLWTKLADSPVEEIKARSQYDLVEERLKAGDLKPAEAIAPLDALRFVYRGGDFEFNLLRKLGALYLGDNQSRKGLVALRQAAANFPDRHEAKEIGEEMSKAFRELYLENGADRLSPLTAVALYDEFRELTPAGADGDRMITLLADRLVKVDLLGRAAELLDTQVKKRLTGLDKVRAGTRLAAIRMLDQKPELALQALKDSAFEAAVPPDLAAERKRLEARATFDSGDTLGGLRMLEGDDSLEAKWLRADMQWRVREWPAAATALGELIAGEEQAMAEEKAAAEAAMDVTKDPAAAIGSAEAEEALKAEQAQHFKDRVAPLVLNRAVALSLASDRRGLKALANEYGKRMESTDQAKAFAMLTAPDNGLVESVSAAMSSVERIDAFVTDYRERLKKASLSERPAGAEE